MKGAATGKTINVTGAGYCYFDGIVWVSGKGIKGDQGIPSNPGPPGPIIPSTEIDGVIGN